jgi:uncharacterized protein YigA (DUF484 family)
MSDPKTLTAENVMAYLETSASFFEQYADRLAAIFVPHPYGGRAISLTERQLIALRERVRQLEHQHQDLTAFGEANDAISSKLHHLALALIGAENAQAVTQLTVLHLREDFAVPHVDLLWHSAPNGRCPPGFIAGGEALAAALPILATPYCGSREGLVIPGMFGQAAAHLQSQALVHLKVPGDAGGEGILAMGSEAPERFYAGMGTLYLTRLGELLSAALAHHLRNPH